MFVLHHKSCWENSARLWCKPHYETFAWKVWKAFYTIKVTNHSPNFSVFPFCIFLYIKKGFPYLHIFISSSFGFVIVWKAFSCYIHFRIIFSDHVYKLMDLLINISHTHSLFFGYRSCFQVFILGMMVRWASSLYSAHILIPPTPLHIDFQKRKLRAKGYFYGSLYILPYWLPISYTNYQL